MKPVLFIDFDGTLCHDWFWRSCEKDLLSKVQDFLFNKNKEIVKLWMRGDYSSEQINELVSKALDVSYINLWDVFVDDCKNMHVAPTTFEQIRKLQANYYTVLITDNMDCFTRFTVPSLNLENYFDQIICSSDTKTLKLDGDGAIFLKVLKEFGSSVAASILIDNSKGACELFSSLGGRSCLVDKKRSVDYWLGKISERK